ncbi:hypothetical protein F5B21DRAFT_504880 [Xylaria acuta]|nr:hypothetical protein F5B21DRAFT_504880 [Xylaria acuta]
MTPQQQLFEEINNCFEKTKDQLKELRQNWGVMKISEIEEVVDAVDEAITLAKSGLSNPTDEDEYNVVGKLLDRMEEYYIEAQGFLHEAKACEEKVAQQKRENSDEGHLSVILELSDEDGA